MDCSRYEWSARDRHKSIPHASYVTRVLYRYNALAWGTGPFDQRASHFYLACHPRVPQSYLFLSYFLTILTSIRRLKSTWMYCLRSCDGSPTAGAQYSSLCNPVRYGPLPALSKEVWKIEETLNWLSLMLPSVIPKGPKLSQSRHDK